MFLNWDQKPVQLHLRSPADSTVLQKNVDINGLSLCYMNGVALFCGQDEIQFVDIEGLFIEENSVNYTIYCD